MDEICYEQMIDCHQGGKTALLRVLLVLASLVLVLLSFLFPISVGDTYFTWFVIALCIDFIIIRLFWNKTAVEYEYIFTDGQIDFDAIYNRKTRKTLISLECKDISLMAPMEEPKYQAIFQQNFNTEFKLYNAQEEKKTAYVIVLKQAAKNTKIIFQPDEKMLKLMKRYNPRNINI